MNEEQPADIVSVQPRWEDGTPKSLDNAFAIPKLQPPAGIQLAPTKKSNGKMFKTSNKPKGK